MKIQAFAIIAIMLLLPMTLILSVYVKNQTKTLDYQVSYDTKLQNATYDALKAFQLNSANSDTSDIANSKLRDVKAGANTFFNALASAFNMPGYGKEELQNFVPAIVFTMYDGYYVYGPFQNVLGKETTTKITEFNDSPLISEDIKKSYKTKYTPSDDLDDLKPYVYYSCRYKKSNGSDELDVVITYALDNYVVIQGTYGNDTSGKITINIDGYLLNRVKVTNPITKISTNTISSDIRYRNIEINNENDDTLSEKVYLNGEVLEALRGVDEDTLDSQDDFTSNTTTNPFFYYLRCRKINGVRYYATKDETTGYSESYPRQQRLVLALLNGEWSATNYVSNDRVLEGIDSNQQSIYDIENNINALEYYQKAALLKAFLTGNDTNCYPASSLDPNSYLNVILEQCGVNDQSAKDRLRDKYNKAGKLIGSLTVGDACTLDGEHIIAARDSADPNDEKFKNLEYFGNADDKIFEFEGREESENTSNSDDIRIVDIEEPESSFNEHRLDVIRYSIESNLSIAIKNFNSYSNSTTYDFQMPRLKDTDWEKIYNNISIITFMQGLSIGGKIYSGYSVVPNNNNKEVVTEDSMMIVYDNGVEDPTIYDPKAKYFVSIPNSEVSNLTAVSKSTVSRASSENLKTGSVRYFYRYPNRESWYDYDSVVTSEGNNNDYDIDDGTSKEKLFQYTNMYDYIEGLEVDLSKNNLAKKYFTALGRERQGMYKVHNNGVFKTLYEGLSE